MNTCSTCKWWVSKSIIGYAARQCSNQKLGMEKQSDEDGLYAPNESSMEGWGFGVFTNPKFGCVHHEPK
jgi:hypothetical protein